jgi:hypothetical protein
MFFEKRRVIFSSDGSVIHTSWIEDVLFPQN